MGVGRTSARLRMNPGRVGVIVLAAMLALPFASTRADAADPIINPPSLPCFVAVGSPGWLPPADAKDDSYTREGADKSDAGDTTFLSLNVPAPGVLANDGSGDWHAALYSAPSHAAQFQLNSDGSFRYVSAPGYFGSDFFTYVRYVTGGECSTGAVVTIAAADHIRAQDDTYTTYVNTPITQGIAICTYVSVCEALENDVATDGNTRVGQVIWAETFPCCTLIHRPLLGPPSRRSTAP